VIGIKLEDFIVENVKRTAKPEQIRNVIEALKVITTLSPAELGHMLYIFASAERAHKMRTSPVEHFKKLSIALKKIKFALDCELCF
jgi:hypothetical protein